MKNRLTGVIFLSRNVPTLEKEKPRAEPARGFSNAMHPA